MIELVVGHRVQAVPGLGPVDGDLEQVTVPADQHVLVRSRSTGGSGGNSSSIRALVVVTRLPEPNDRT